MTIDLWPDAHLIGGEWIAGAKLTVGAGDEAGVRIDPLIEDADVSLGLGRDGLRRGIDDYLELRTVSVSA